jgi:hypothetical protein
MTNSHPIGDKGQRYEIWCKDGEHDLCIGWSDNPNSFASMVEKHPVWHSRRVVDRHQQVKQEG